MNQLYSKKVLEHFRHPRNMGEMKKPDGVATVGNPLCGDVMKLYIKVQQTTNNKQQREEIIKDIKFQTLGCGAAIATSSILTEIAKGKPLSEAKKITNRAIAEALDGLPPAKRHCSVLAAKALKEAIENYQKKR
jgi:nitrogen fixation NifU-like protein